MTYTKWLDPIGPGSPAWKAFDAALEAYHLVPAGEHHRHNYHYHRYSNMRDYMVLYLRRDGASESLILEWKASLRQQCKLGEPQ